MGAGRLSVNTSPSQLKNNVNDKELSPPTSLLNSCLLKNTPLPTENYVEELFYHVLTHALAESRVVVKCAPSLSTCYLSNHLLMTLL